METNFPLATEAEDSEGERKFVGEQTIYVAPVLQVFYEVLFIIFLLNRD